MTKEPFSHALRATLLALGLVATLAACGSPRTVDAIQVLHYVDEPTDALRADLGTPFPRHVVTRTHDPVTFNEELGTGRYDLVFVFVHAEAPNVRAGPVPDPALLEDHLNDGGRLVLADFSRTAGYAELFDATYTGARNLEEADLTDPALSAGLDGPLSLENPSGWNDYAMGLAAGDASRAACRFENGDACLVRGHDGRAALLGFLGDTIPEAQARTFWRNLVAALMEA